SDSESRLQPIDDGDQTLHIGGVAGPEFAAERIAVVVQHHAHHHLPEVGTMILRVSALADGLASLALEVDRGGVEEHDVQLGEQVPAPGEQLLFDEVLVGAGSERRGAILLVFGEGLAQPGHGPVEVVQVQLAGSFDGVIVFPLFGGSVAAGGEESMQHGEGDWAFDGELKAPPLEQSSKDGINRAGLPEAREEQGRSDPRAVSGDAVAARMGAEDGEFLGEAPEGLDQGVELAAGEELVEAAHPVENALLNFAVDPDVIDDQQIGSGTVGLGADEQVSAPVSPMFPRIRPKYNSKIELAEQQRVTTHLRRALPR